MTREEAAALLYCTEIIPNIHPDKQKDFDTAFLMAIEALRAPEILTQDDLRLIRKVLSCVNTLYTVAEPEYKENKIDLLLHKLRAMGIDN